MDNYLLDSIASKEITRLKNGQLSKLEDDLSIEEPLEIRIRYHTSHGIYRTVSIAVTMRTPGTDEFLARGFLFTEGMVSDQSQIVEAKQTEPNIIEVLLGEDVQFNPSQFSRNFYTTSSCGVCGKASIESIHSETIHLPWKSGFKIESEILMSLPKILFDQQVSFSKTGGIHACALVDKQGVFIDIKEDVGRHNAMDKLIGANPNYPLSDAMILVSGRASFELVQKASKAGVGLMAAIGAPSSLAVQLAEEQGMTLMGFLKRDGFNIYCGEGRVLH
ncbi:MAG: FdhD protein [Saprospiraceae bacterium]|jgi:FdhD protein|tara:strand:+ start:994 stop:1821 length:828 start_codon:yes stop_codon:yes gene_type:complete